ncbi:MAG: hypothetical protein JWP45_2586 [Mucilaginibacter sp.]|jgi:hypothetical protein|nr:hypothetical protein [Mucilaginibacter sp.]
MKKGYLIFVLILVTTLSYAQSDSSKLSSNAGPIQYKPGGVFRGGKFIINGERVNGKQVNVLLMNNPASAGEFKEFKKDRNRTDYFGIPALSFLVGSMIAGGRSNTLKGSSKIMAGIGFGLIIPEIIFAIKRNKHYKRSFIMYNQQFQK